MLKSAHYITGRKFRLNFFAFFYHACLLRHFWLLRASKSLLVANLYSVSVLKALFRQV